MCRRVAPAMLTVWFVVIAAIFAAPAEAQETTAAPATRPRPPRPEPKEYFVATTGDDENPGTKDRPFRTIQKGADVAQVGDTVTIGGGVYHETVVIRRGGWHQQPQTTYRAAAGEEVIIDGADAPGSRGIIDTNACDYVTLQGLTARNATGETGIGISVYGSWMVRVENCRTINTRMSGILVDKSARVVVSGCEVTQACQQGGEESISVKRSQLVDVLDIHVHHTRHEGIDIKEGSNHVLVKGNRIHDVERQGLYADSADSYTSHIRFEHNTVFDCGFGMVAGAESGGLLEEVTFVDNVVYNCPGPGMIVADWGSPGRTHVVRNVTFANNTVVNTGTTWGGGMVFENREAENVVVRNNILSGNGQGQLRVKDDKLPVSHTVENNLLDGPTDALGQNNLTGDPLFVDRANADFRLRPDSPAAAAGLGARLPSE